MNWESVKITNGRFLWFHQMYNIIFEVWIFCFGVNGPHWSDMTQLFLQFSIISGKAMQKTFLLCRSRSISCIIKRLSMSLSSFNCCSIQLPAFWTILVTCRSASFNSSRFRPVSSFNTSYSWASSDFSSTSLRIIYQSFQTFGRVEIILYKLHWRLPR